MSSAPAVTLMGQASGDTDLDPLEAHVSPMAIRHLTSSPQLRLPEHPGGSPAATDVAVQTCTEPPTRDGLRDWPDKAAPPGQPAILPGRCAAPRPRHSRQSVLPAETGAAPRPPAAVPKVDVKTPVVTPGWTPAQADPAAECDPAGLREKAGEGKRLGGLTGLEGERRGWSGGCHTTSRT